MQHALGPALNMPGNARSERKDNWKGWCWLSIIHMLHALLSLLVRSALHIADRSLEESRVLANYRQLINKDDGCTAYVLCFLVLPRPYSLLPRLLHSSSSSQCTWIFDLLINACPVFHFIASINAIHTMLQLVNYLCWYTTHSMNCTMRVT